MDTKHVRTSGAYILFNGYFPFQVGPTRKGDKLGIVRLGGHREKDETAPETAIREVLEEAAMDIRIVSSPTTYFKRNWNEPAVKILVNEEIAPILIKGSDPASSTAMYLAYADTEPVPSNETNGLLLLTPEDIRFLCSNKFTLNNFMEQGGRGVLKNDLNGELLLEPFPQLLFLGELLEKESDLMEEFFTGGI
ncbi:NUDIX domain-containing protein [Mesobacillus subterraneus]|uniref:NUDIX hydrolase n=1 Tax=Mesobacillus subterraneus TaxID=285983 RepID=A0A3R9F4E7_9BACI|nr:NUDIX domain-containing protein [Mesobacillus subterraneus]RSD28789.1 NUDIX hydrolase [Mesobacillus subterraneus]